MGKLLRSRPCSCGSGRPARSCCGRFRRVSERDAAIAHVRRQSRRGWETVSPFSSEAIAALQDEAAALPARSETFSAALSTGRDPVGSDVRRLGRALQRAGSPDHPAVHAALRRADTPVARAAVAKAIAALRESGEVDEYLAGAALFDLSGYRSRITDAALLAAAATVSGRPVAARTPARPAATPPSTAAIVRPVARL